MSSSKYTGRRGLLAGKNPATKMTIAVSACLLGERCRYDGESKGCADVMALAAEHTLLPFCPEAPVLGTPRGRISVVEEGGVRRLLKDDTNEDVTEAILGETDAFLAAHERIDFAILKSKSPSCGLGTAPVLDRDRNVLGCGNGFAAERFVERGLQVTDEHHIIKGE